MYGIASRWNDGVTNNGRRVLIPGGGFFMDRTGIQRGRPQLDISHQTSIVSESGYLNFRRDVAAAIERERPAPITAPDSILLAQCIENGKLPMVQRLLSDRAKAIMSIESSMRVDDFFHDYLAARGSGNEAADFTFGNPHDMPLVGVVDALRTWIEPRDKDWFAYKASEPKARDIVAASLQRFLGMPFEPEDIAMTNGGFGAIVVALKLVANPGDEVIFSLPPWFSYEPICVEAGLTPVKVRINSDTFDLDLDAIADAITARTRVVIVNTPQNPTGKVLSAETLARLASLLDDASERYGQRIYLVSDEPYNRIVFDGFTHRSPLEFYPYAFLAYSYSKTLMMPGQRMGYLTMPPTMPREDREQLRVGIESLQYASGYLFPNALLQHAIEDLEGLTLDVAHQQRKRDQVVDALLDMGYEVQRAEGTFYLFPKSPIPDDDEFSRLLAAEGVLVFPGSVFETPGFFRICLTANDAMIERGLPGFERAIRRV